MASERVIKKRNRFASIGSETVTNPARTTSTTTTTAAVVVASSLLDGTVLTNKNPNTDVKTSGGDVGRRSTRKGKPTISSLTTVASSSASQSSSSSPSSSSSSSRPRRKTATPNKTNGGGGNGNAATVSDPDNDDGDDGDGGSGDDVDWRAAQHTKWQRKPKSKSDSSKLASTALFFDTVEELTEWYETKGATVKTEQWFGIYLKKSGKMTLSARDLLEVALCYGWIDSRGKNIDESRWMMRFTPRKSLNWSALNRSLVNKLIKEGRMMAAGRAVLPEDFEEDNDDEEDHDDMEQNNKKKQPLKKRQRK